MSVKVRNILISGAGIAGPTLAYWLLRRGFTPTIVEQAPSPRTGGYVIDFWGLGWEVAERMGLTPRLVRDGYRMKELRLVNDAGRPVARLTLTCSEPQPEIGSRASTGATWQPTFIH